MVIKVVDAPISLAKSIEYYPPSLVVDAGEGPKSQTKYVLSRALSLGLVPIVVLNRADRSESLGRLESGETELDLMDLFESFGAKDGQMEYRTSFGSARGGWITSDVNAAVRVGNGGNVEGIEGVFDMRSLVSLPIEGYHVFHWILPWRMPVIL